MAIKKKLQSKLTDQQRIEFTKQIEYFYESSHADLKKVVTFSFYKGMATGLGVFLGGTIIAALVLWGLSQLSGLPFVGQISKAADHSISQTKANQ